MNSTGQDVNAGTMAVRETHRFDEARLATWLAAHVAGYHGPLTVEQFKGGQSNPTYKLITPGRAYVLRRKPPGPLLKGAHAVEREAKVLTALGKTGFPVPHVHGLCQDDSIIGTWFYVMEMVEGRIFWDATLPEIERTERPAYFEALTATLARLHKVNYAAAGLAEYGRPGNYFARQIARWSQQYHDGLDAGGDLYLDRLVEWLPDNIPSSDETSIVHGDLRLDNVIFHQTEPRILAVLDWELSTLGHPLADFSYTAMMYRMPPHIVAGLADTDLTALNIPSEADFVAAYCRHASRDSIPGYNFYIAFNFFRLAAIFHGIKGRIARGTAASAQALERVKVLPELTELAWRQAEKAGAR
jgi:aminoglycoside phosphotransferase (APT) family kinase protein